MPYQFTKEMDVVMAGMPFGFMRADLHANVVYSNGYLQKMYGIAYDALAGNAWQQLIHPDDKKRILMLFAKDYFSEKVTVIATRLVFHENVVVPVMFLIDSLFDESNKRIGFMVNIVDVSLALHDLSVQPEAEHIDPLTQLVTRADFLTKLAHVLHISDTKSIALVLVDLRGLENINQLWGYAVGDQLLMAMADRLRSSRGEFFLGRLESDKFGLIIDSFQSHEELKKITAFIHAACSESITLPQGKFVLAVSLGVAVNVSDESDVDILLRHVYEALSSAKKKNTRVEFFDEKMHRVYRRNSRIVASLFDAIAQDQFELQYQPQVDAETEKLIGIEVLLRWKHPELGIIEPDEFISIAEESGFIIHVGKWVMNQALKQYKNWMNHFHARLSDVKLSINISPLQLLDENLIDDLTGLLDKYHVQASSLILELTENAIMTHPQKSVHVLNQLKELGMSVSMDDFGTGYSSLNYMRYLPINQIKIDRSFIRAFDHSKQDAAVIKATILLAEAIGIDVIAEGVETENELQFLRENGCRLIQGYYYSHPLNAQGMEEYIEANV